MHGLGYSLKVPRQNVHSNIQDKDSKILLSSTETVKCRRNRNQKTNS